MAARPNARWSRKPSPLIRRTSEPLHHRALIRQRARCRNDFPESESLNGPVALSLAPIDLASGGGLLTGTEPGRAGALSGTVANLDLHELRTRLGPTETPRETPPGRWPGSLAEPGCVRTGKLRYGSERPQAFSHGGCSKINTTYNPRPFLGAPDPRGRLRSSPATLH